MQPIGTHLLRREIPVRQDLPATQEPQDRQDPRVLPVRQDRQVVKARLVIQDQQDLPAE